MRVGMKESALPHRGVTKFYLLYDIIALIILVYLKNRRGFIRMVLINDVASAQGLVGFSSEHGLFYVISR